MSGGVLSTQRGRFVGLYGDLYSPTAFDVRAAVAFCTVGRASLMGQAFFDGGWVRAAACRHPKFTTSPVSAKSYREMPTSVSHTVLVHGSEPVRHPHGFCVTEKTDGLDAVT